MTSPTLSPHDPATSAADEDYAVDNYERRSLYGHTVQFRPGPIAGDPAEIGQQIRELQAENAEE